jgi:hypothetical protein
MEDMNNILGASVHMGKWGAKISMHAPCMPHSAKMLNPSAPSPYVQHNPRGGGPPTTHTVYLGEEDSGVRLVGHWA